MSADNFENSVQQKLDELRVVPSDAVWNSVEEQLRRDKKRRRILILLPTLIVIGVVGWWISGSKSDSVPIVKIEKQTKNDKQNSKLDPSSIDISKTENSGQDHHISSDIKKDQIDQGISKEDNKAGTDLTTQTLDDQLQAIEKTTIQETSKSSIIPGKQEKNKVSVSKAEVIEISQRELEQSRKSKKVNNKTSLSTDLVEIDFNSSNSTDKSKLLIGAVPGIKIQNDIQEENEFRPAKLLMPSKQMMSFNTAGILSRELSMSNLLDNAPTTAKNIEREKSKSKSLWRVGMTGGLGVAKLVEGSLLNAFEKSVVADAANFNSNIGLPGPVNLQSRASLVAPAAVRPGLSFTIGGFAERKLNKRLALSLGLQYSFAQNSNRIGTQIDSAIFINNSSSVGTYDRFFQNNSSQNYKSKYHFVELPINLQLRLTEHKKTPLFLNGGVSLGYLVSTNALHYDGGYGIYYSDNSLFGKWQVGITTGFGIRLFNSSKNPLEIGPHLHYRMNSIYSIGNGKSSHLLNGGLSFKWYLR